MSTVRGHFPADEMFEKSDESFHDQVWLKYLYGIFTWQLFQVD